jgi:iron complex outermembrane receptor protein
VIKTTACAAFVASSIISMPGAALAAAEPADTAEPADAAGPTAAAEPVAAASSGSELEEITVTARRRVEAAQSTPVSITAFKPEELARRSIVNIEQLARATPSFNLQNSAYDPFAAAVGIRGQQATDVVLTQPPPIGIYVDDVYDASGAALNLLNFDNIEQVEVLKGPQGTLYGRNTTGGAIKVTTPLPDYDGVHGSGKLGFGNYADKVFSGSVNLPVIDHRVAVNLSGRVEDRGGFGTVVGTGQDMSDWQSESFRAAIRFDVNEQVQLVARGWYAHALSSGQPSNITYVVPGATAANLATATQIGALTPTDFGILAGQIVPTPQQLAAFGADVNAGYRALSQYIVSPYSQNGYDPSPALLKAFGVDNIGIRGHEAEAKVYGGSFTANYQITSDLYIKSISATGVTKRASQQNTGGSPFLLIVGSIIDQEPRQFTEELQIGGSAFDQALQWVTGYYYFDMNGHDSSDPVLQVVPLGPTPSHEQAEVLDISHAGYSQATYAITHDIHFTGGIRYTKERTNSVNYTYSVIGGVPVCQAVPGAPVSPETCVTYSPSQFTNWSYTGGFDWQITPDLMVYAKTSRGFRAGGAGIRPPFLSFRPEEVTDYEVGEKSEWLDHRVRVNVALYQSNYSDIQRTVLTTVPGTAQVDTAIQNAAKAKIRGAELEVLTSPFGGLTVGLSGAFIDAGYLSYTDAEGDDFSHHVFANTPRWQGDVTASYVYPAAWGDLTTTVDFAWKGWVDYQPDNHVVIDGVLTNGNTTQSGYGIFNARMSQKIRALGDLTVSIWGRNLADKQYTAYGTDIAGPLGFIEVQPGIPRTFGVEVSKQF